MKAFEEPSFSGKSYISVVLLNFHNNKRSHIIVHLSPELSPLFNDGLPMIIFKSVNHNLTNTIIEYKRIAYILIIDLHNLFYVVTILFAIQSESGDPSSGEMTADTGSSTSTTAGIPPKDTSSDEASSSSKARSVSLLCINILSYNTYNNLCWYFQSY